MGDRRSVAEGVETTPGVLALAEGVGVEMPIAEQVHAVLVGDRSPTECVDLLMGRRPRPELNEPRARRPSPAPGRAAPAAIASSRAGRLVRPTPGDG